MSYTNNAGQTVEIGDRVAYAGYHGHLYLGKVIGFTATGAPRIELEGKFVPMVRHRYRKDRTYVMHSGAPIWDRRPWTHWRHKVQGYLITSEQFYQIPRPDRDQYEHDGGQLSREWTEFKVPAVHPIAKPKQAFVVEKGTKA